MALSFSAGLNYIYAQPATGNVIPADKRTGSIACVVRIRHSTYLPDAGHYLILMTDETRRQVAPSQVYQAGVSDYTFFEPGPMTGTRIARMLKLPIGPHSNDIPPTVKTGTFYCETGYLFIIRPIPMEKAVRNDIN